jgi:class 3 adenylate cyclase/tetratricopeptide (TPR) repeat protein
MGLCRSCGAENPASGRFCGQCGAQIFALPEERRWVTVVFADLSGFTALAETMDPEDVRVLVDRAFRQLRAIVERYGGTVNRMLGDGMLAVFGAPVAHEDDAERAVRASLEMVGRVAERSDDFGGLSLRVGIGTGEVMFATAGSDADVTVLGDVVNTAARLQQAARRGGVLVGAMTVRSCPNDLSFIPVAPVQAKGKAEPVPAWEAVGAPIGGVRQRRVVAPLIGRDGELAVLRDTWSRMRAARRPAVVTVIGEPGVGKSRLVDELCRELAAAPSEVRVLRGRCLPYGESLAYGAVAAIVRQAAGIGPEDSAAEARSRLAAMVISAGVPDDEELLEHLTLLVGLPADPGEGGAVVYQDRLRRSFRRWLEALAADRPMCISLEDVHWADDSLLDLVEYVMNRVREVPIMVVMQARPELADRRPGWRGSTTVFSVLPLEDLQPDAATELALALCAAHGADVDAALDACGAAGGNPLYAEEIVAMVASGETSPCAGGLPPTITALIEARLDLLDSEERHVVQLASVLGPVFWEGALASMGAPSRVPDVLDRLEVNDLVRASSRTAFSGEPEYRFKHALIRDVAYGMVPRARRRELHAVAADWIEKAAGARAEEYLDQLVYHATQADQGKRTLDYLVRAAERARRTAAHRTEAEILGEAILAAERLGDVTEAAHLRAARGSALSHAAAWGEAGPELEAALAGLPTECVMARASAELNLSEVCFWLLDTAGQRNHAESGLALAEQAGDHKLAGSALASLAQAAQAEGDLATAGTRQLQAVSRAGGIFHQFQASAGLPFYLAGDLDRALALSEQAVAAARIGNDTTFTMYALPHLGLALAARGRYHEADALFEEARRFGTELGAAPLVARSIAMAAGPAADALDYQRAVDADHEAREMAQSLNFAPTAVSAAIDLLIVNARRGAPDADRELEAVVAESVGTIRNWHEWLWQLRFSLARAELALARGDVSAAVTHADDAMARAGRYSRPKYEADAAVVSGRALAHMGRRNDALVHLRRARALATGLDSPALTIRVGAALLEVGPDDDEGVSVSSETLAAADRIRSGLGPAGRKTFDEAEVVRILSAQR